jgi:hypothetical protein
MNRAEFIKAFFRLSFLAGLGAMIAFFFSKGKISLTEECPDISNCKSCRKLESCKLPESQNVRKYGK